MFLFLSVLQSIYPLEIAVLQKFNSFLRAIGLVKHIFFKYCQMKLLSEKFFSTNPQNFWVVNSVLTAKVHDLLNIKLGIMGIFRPNRFVNYKISNYVFFFTTVILKDQFCFMWFKEKKVGFTTFKINIIKYLF